MGQKVDPRGMRIGINKTWTSSWYANKKQRPKFLFEDMAIRKAILKMLGKQGISLISIERSANKVVIHIHTSKPGVIIGRAGDNIQRLRDHLSKTFQTHFLITIEEIKDPDLDARLQAQSIGMQVEKRIPYRRAVKAVLAKIMESGARGAKIFVAGRLNGAEIARSEYFKDGNIPLHTFRSDIDYAFDQASTAYGIIGIKVWIYKGDVFAQNHSS